MLLGLSIGPCLLHAIIWNERFVHTNDGVNFQGRKLSNRILKYVLCDIVKKEKWWSKMENTWYAITDWWILQCIYCCIEYCYDKVAFIGIAVDQCADLRCYQGRIQFGNDVGQKLGIYENISTCILTSLGSYVVSLIFDGLTMGG